MFAKAPVARPVGIQRAPIRTVRTGAIRTFTEVVPYGGSSRVDIIVHPTEADVALAVVANIEAAANAAIAKNGIFTIAVPGGSALKALKNFALRKNSVDWRKVHVFFVNHKSSIKLDDPSSTAQRVKDFFGTSVGLPVENIWAPLGSGSADKDAADYITKLKSAASKLKLVTTEEGIPRFDVILIGVGSDGHIGSIYANKPAATQVSAGPWVVTSTKADGASSITLTLPVLNAAKSAIVAISGGKKADMVRQTLEVAQPVGASPIQLLKPVQLTWILDQAAASGLAAQKAISEQGRTDINVVQAYLKLQAPEVDLSDPLERYCVANPDADECRVYED